MKVNMADMTKLKEAISGLSASVDAAVKEIEALKAQDAEGASSGPTQAELDEDASRIESEAARLMAAKGV